MTPSAPGVGTAELKGHEGFSLVEVVVALLILAFGVLGLAGTTALVIRQMTIAELATQRASAFQSAVERLRALSWGDVTAGSTTHGPYAVNWWVHEAGTQHRVMKIATTGPGLGSSGGVPALRPDVADTFTYVLLRP